MSTGLSHRERMLSAVQELEKSIEDRLHSDNLIGTIVAVQTSPSEQTPVRPRPVTFGWQRGIKIGLPFNLLLLHLQSF